MGFFADLKARRDSRQAEAAEKLASKLERKSPGGVLVKTYGNAMAFKRDAVKMAAAGWMASAQSSSHLSGRTVVTYHRQASSQR